jgi:hypothetical protein
MSIALERYRREEPIDLRTLLPDRAEPDASESMRRGPSTETGPGETS